ncbi:MAG: phosphoglucosamine mutase [Thermanaerothrix sp.]|nr:phosphoglucosamine mutase [Thermanaerothrix sp.]
MSCKTVNRKYFGTDGVRDVANRGAMTPEMAMRLGVAYARFLKGRGVENPRVIVCRDTRASGQMLELALGAGMMSMGATVVSGGVLPTPGVSFVLRGGTADGGAVVSASHNPAEYNGIKFFGPDGQKLSDEDEASIEALLDFQLDHRPAGLGMGSYRETLEFREQYSQWLSSCYDGAKPVKGIVVDCANGAIGPVAERVFATWEPRIIGVEPDGANINRSCGVMHMECLADQVIKSGAPLGVAFDGDADRTLFCDPRGRVVDGDLMLWVLARWLKSRGELGSGVVATVMSNMALEEKLSSEGIKLFRCPVGDRYVLETMKRQGAMLGGEQSGHVIVKPWVESGDGLCTALLFVRACQELGESFDALWDRFERYPQKLINFKVKDRDGVLNSDELAAAVKSAEEIVGQWGRVFVRPSGTEPLIRVLLEAKDPNRLESAACVFFDALEPLLVE